LKTIHGLEIGQNLEDFCRPDRMALLIYDMQVGIARQVRDAANITSRIARVLATARAKGFRVIFMRHLSMPPELMGAFQYRQAMAWQRKSDPQEVHSWFLRDAPGFQIVPELQPAASEAILDKITFSAFEGTPLAMILRDCRLTAFAICGIATEIGIEPTVRHGADLGLVPIVIADACGSGRPEAGERSLASIGFMGDAIVSTVDEMIARMENRA